MDRFQHSIKTASKRSGLTPHVIRVWERRYGVINPGRTATNRRVYTESEIERLTLLRQAIAAGYRIGNIARLEVLDLRKLVASAPALAPAPAEHREDAGATRADFPSLCLMAVRRMDATELEAVLTRALLVLGHQGLLRQVVAPLTQSLGQLWQQGELSAAHEHFATAFLRTFLGQSPRPFPSAEGTPTLLVATPSGQLHELGAIMISSLARNLGWRVIYLGVSLPAAEIAGAAVQRRCRAVALSLVYPEDDPGLPRELRDLRRYLPAEVSMLAGGRAAVAYRDALDQIGALRSGDLDEFTRQLEVLRKQSPQASSAE